MEYITREEFEKALNRYDKLGTAEKYVGKMDAELRKYQKDLVDSLEFKNSQLLETKLATVSDKISSAIKASESNIKNSIMKEVSEVLDATKTHISESVLSSVYKSLKDISLQTEQTINNQLSIAKAKFSNEIEQFSKSVELEMGSKLSLFEHSMQTYTQDKINAAVGHSSSLFTKTMNGIVSDFHSETISLVLDLRTSLSDELGKKIVDKAAIESKFAEIESEMKSKVQQLITFQLDQARNVMEQSARAEINESLKTLTGNFLGSL